MKKVLFYSLILAAGLIASQFLPDMFGAEFPTITFIIRVLMMIALAFIMIHVGYEFDIDKGNLKQYGVDYLVAMTAAAFPWIFVTAYFMFVMLPSGMASDSQAWKETLLAGRFAAPTSAGVLFSMLAAAGLSATWLFKKARILAIFDDLDTVLLMIPLKIMMVGLAWQLGGIVVLMGLMLWIGWHWLHRVALKSSWKWVLFYASIIVIVSEILYKFSIFIDDSVPIHIEVLLPAFILGCVLKHPEGTDPHTDDSREGHQEGPESPEEQIVSSIISAIFMGLVGLSMPSIINSPAADVVRSKVQGTDSILATMQNPNWEILLFHVIAVTIISNIGKMFPIFMYRKEASIRERLAVSIGMWPRGEVGAGVLVLSIGYGIGGPILTVAIISLALNLMLTGFFIWIVKKLLRER